MVVSLSDTNVYHSHSTCTGHSQAISEFAVKHEYRSGLLFNSIVVSLEVSQANVLHQQLSRLKLFALIPALTIEFS